MSLTASHRVHSKRRSIGLAPFRRLWILPVSIVVVAAIAYAVAGLQSSTYTAQSNVVVTSAPGPLSGNSAGASSLAATYAGGLPNDPTLQAYVAKTAHVNPLGTIPRCRPRARCSPSSSSPTPALTRWPARRRSRRAEREEADEQRGLVQHAERASVPVHRDAQPGPATTANASAAAARSALATGVTASATSLPLPRPTRTWLRWSSWCRRTPAVRARASTPTTLTSWPPPTRASSPWTRIAGRRRPRGPSIPLRCRVEPVVINEQNTSILEITYKASIRRRPRPARERRRRC